MKYIDTRDTTHVVDFKTAIMEGMNPVTGGLYMPEDIPQLPYEFLHKDPVASFRDIALETAKIFVGNEIPEEELAMIIADAYPFSTPVIPIDPTTYILELFHGPTCAFKDVGARFMARVMSYVNRNENQPLHILVATSGDTGSAVGSAFSGVEGIDVTILYPAGKISALQEKQLSTFTGNVRALSVDGSFDDCQALVKKAFTDDSLRKNFRLSSANSINISRLLPQSFYYTYASLVVANRSLLDNKIENPYIIMSVPSGNFGNLTSGIIARELGAPIAGFIAATNSNKTVPDWLLKGNYEPRPSIQTISNAMDVGNPSNFERINFMLSVEEARSLIAGYWLNDDLTVAAMRDCHMRTGYILDPHGAVAWRAWDDIRKTAMAQLLKGSTNACDEPGLTAQIPSWAQKAVDGKCIGIVLETAHPAKFGETVHKAIGREPSIPDRLERVLSLPDRSVPIKASYSALKAWMYDTLN